MDDVDATGKGSRVGVLVTCDFFTLQPRSGALTAQAFGQVPRSARARHEATHREKEVVYEVVRVS